MKGADTIISICICTFRRPMMLEELLNSILQDLELPGSTEVIVVDNDKDESARGIVEKHSRGLLPVRYFVEPEQNISLARNRTVSEARGEWLAMIDDDELPDPGWLESLFRCARLLDADAVFGPVEPIYSNGCPRWIIDGRFIEKGHSSTGTKVLRGQTRTSNVLLRRDLIVDRDGPFDRAFGLSGGEDSLLFDGLLLEGKRFYWCDEAVVKEHIPAERATWQRLLKRSFRGGQTYGRLVLCGFGKGRPSTPAKALFLCRTVVHCCVSVVMWMATLPFGRIRWFRWLRAIAIQLGKASAFMPFVYREYAEPL